MYECLVYLRQRKLSQLFSRRRDWLIREGTEIHFVMFIISPRCYALTARALPLQHCRYLFMTGGMNAKSTTKSLSLISLFKIMGNIYLQSPGSANMMLSKAELNQHGSRPLYQFNLAASLISFQFYNVSSHITKCGARPIK